MAEGAFRIAKITLDERTIIRRNPDIEHERASAIFDLLEENLFAPASGVEGPFQLYLEIEESRLILEIRTTDDAALERISLPLAALRTIIKDYFLICESYNNAVRTAPLSRIGAIDQGRRALHNEAAALLQARLADHVRVDFNTARRLFTLVCVLHVRG